MMLALIQDGTTILKIVREGATFSLPDGRVTSPALAGWALDNYQLLTVLDADPVPPGKRVVSTTIAMVGPDPKYVHTLEDIPTDDEVDTAAINQTLLEEGSVFRGVVELIFQEINKLRVKDGDPAYTLQQFKDALKARMRT